MQIAFAVRLPGDARSVPFVRGLCRQALEHLGVEGALIDEITLALSESCANAVQHAGGRQDYEVDVAIDDDDCRITVSDAGPGFDSAAVLGDGSRSVLDDGSGLLLMRALVDELDFRLESDGRHRVTFSKHLRLAEPTAAPSA